MSGKILVLVSAVLVSAGCTNAKASDPAATGAATDAPVKVDTTKVTSKAMPTFLNLTGTLVSPQDSDVAAAAAGKVTRTLVDRGSDVKAGEALVVLDNLSAEMAAREARANANSAKARAELAKTEKERADALFAQKAMNTADHDRAVVETTAAEQMASAAESMATRLEKGFTDTTVRAPFAGVVVDRGVDAGEWVGMGARVARVVQIDPLRLQIPVPEASLQSVHEGQQVQFEVAAWPGERFAGTVRFVAPAMREQTRDFVVEAEVPNKDHRLRPGMFAIARVEGGTAETAAVPAAAVRRSETADSVFLIRDGKIEQRVVQLGETQGDVISILTGLKPGDLVVARAATDVHDGQKVQ